MLRRFFSLFPNAFLFFRRSQLARLLLLFVVTLGLLNGAIYFVTETQWWNAQGLGQVWRARCLAQVGLWCVAVLLALVVGGIFLKPGLKPTGDAIHLRPPYRTVAEQLFHWQRTVSRTTVIVWLLAVVWCGWEMASYWPQWFGFRFGESFGLAQGNQDAGLWVWRLPWLLRVLDTSWALLSLLLILALMLYGMRVALLPFERERLADESFRVAAQRVLRPVMGLMAVWFLVRAIGYVLHLRADWTRSAALVLPAVLGVLFCLMAALWLAAWMRDIKSFHASTQRKGHLRWGRRTGVLALLSLFALVLPMVLLAVLSLGVAKGTFDSRATRFAWQLNDVASQRFAIADEFSDAERLQRASAVLKKTPPLIIRQHENIASDSVWISEVNRPGDAAAKIPLTVSISRDEPNAKVVKWNERADETLREIGKNNLAFGPHTQRWNVTTQTKSRGISLRSFWNRVWWAWRLRSLQLLFSPGDARLLPRSNPVEVAAAIAPFLRVDGEPYPALHHEKLVWMLDLLSTSERFAGSLSTHIIGDSQLEAARDSVKMCMDAETGAVSFYAVRDDEPFLKAWQRAFPSLILPVTVMPLELRQSRRYPKQLFAAQREVLQILGDLPLQNEAPQFGFQTLPDTSTRFVLQSWARGDEITALLADCDDYGRLEIWRFAGEMKAPSKRQGVAKTWWPVWESSNNQTRLLELVTIEPQYEKSNELWQLSRIRIEDAFAPQELNASGPDLNAALAAFDETGKAQRSLNELIDEALRNHQEIEQAAASDWARFGSVAKEQKALLEKMRQRTANE